MNALRFSGLALLATMLVAPGARGSGAFDSGSNGSFGPLNAGYGSITTIDLPPDGIIHATTVSLGD